MTDAGDDVSSLVTIPAVEWRSFLERFGRRHRAGLATIHGLVRGKPVTRIPSVALSSVRLDRHGPDHVVRLTFLNGIALCAPTPRGVRVQRTDDDVEGALEVDTADGAFVRLAFRPAASRASVLRSAEQQRETGGDDHPEQRSAGEPAKRVAS